MALDASDLIGIIHACGKNGVTRLKLDGLGELDFVGTVQKDLVQVAVAPESTVQINSKNLDESHRLEISKAIKEAEIGNLLFEDPVTYDRLSEAGQLRGTDAGTSDGGEEDLLD